jgi:hypothetical protein
MVMALWWQCHKSFALKQVTPVGAAQWWAMVKELKLQCHKNL